MAKKQKSEYPFSIMDRTGYIPAACPIVVVGESFEAGRLIRKDLWPEVKVVDGTVLWTHLAKDHETSLKENTIYYRVPEKEPLESQKNVAHLRYMALEYGATPEAIRLLNRLLPFTDKECKIMAEKLKAKASAAKPDKEGLKSAAKAAPVAKKGASKGRGNPEALAKARAARAENKGPDNRKIKANIKAKDIEARAGSKRHAMLTDLLASKTVQEFRDKGHSSGDLAYATGANIVSVS